jgi:hypothetical protein
VVARRREPGRQRAAGGSADGAAVPLEEELAERIEGDLARRCALPESLDDVVSEPVPRLCLGREAGLVVPLAVLGPADPVPTREHGDVDTLGGLKRRTGKCRHEHERILSVWAVLIAGGSLLVACTALVWTIHTDQQQRKALARESAERKAADAREEHRRNEELEVHREHLRQAEAHDRDQRVAMLVGKQLGSPYDLLINRVSRVEDGVEYIIQIRNLGPAAAEDVSVLIAERGSDGIARSVTGAKKLGAMLAGEDWVTLRLLHRDPIVGTNDASHTYGLIWASWIDGRDGLRNEEIGLISIFPSAGGPGSPILTESA